MGMLSVLHLFTIWDSAKQTSDEEGFCGVKDDGREFFCVPLSDEQKF